MKRYCQTLSLLDDPVMIEQYCREHANVWPVVEQNMREVGILDMQIFRLGNLLFMIMDVVDDFDWVRDNARLAGMPHQAEWEAHVARLQGADPNAPSTDKWKLMEQIYQMKVDR